jgi:hypothetical protein
MAAPKQQDPSATLYPSCMRVIANDLVHLSKDLLNMNTAFSKALKGFRRIIVPGLMGLTALLVVAHFSWKYSGSNEWKLVKEEGGVRVYTQKSPGSTLLKVKADMRVKTSLSSAVYLLRGGEDTVEDFGGKDFKVMDLVDTPELYHAYYSVKHVMPPPFSTKELVVLLNYAQDKKNKQVVINVQAAPSRIAPSPDAVRITHLNNIFRVTPLPGGEVNWEVTLDVDMGVAYPLANLSMPEYLFQDLTKHKKLVLTEKYQNARMASVQEL